MSKKLYLENTLMSQQVFRYVESCKISFKSGKVQQNRCIVDSLTGRKTTEDKLSHAVSDIYIRQSLCENRNLYCFQ